MSEIPSGVDMSRDAAVEQRHGAPDRMPARWRVRLLLDVLGLAVVGGAYAATKSTGDQVIALLFYSAAFGLLAPGGLGSGVPWLGRSFVVRTQVYFWSIVLVWVAFVVFVISPATKGEVGPWFSWWLVIVPSIEFRRVLSQRVASAD
jgi:hypothetical protein